MSIQKVGARLTLEGADEFASGLKKGADAANGLMNKLKGLGQGWGANSSAMKNYEAQMRSLKVQAADAERRLNNLTKTQKEYTKSNEQLNTKMRMTTAAMERKKAVSAQVQKSIDAQDKVVKELSKTYGRNSEAARNARTRLTELRTEYSNNEKAVRSLTQQNQRFQTQLEKQKDWLDSAPAKIERATAEFGRYNNQIRQTHENYRNNGGRLADVANRWSNAGERLTSVGDRMTNAGIGLTAATAGVTMGMRNAVNRAMEFESGIAGINKTVDGTPEQINKISKEILDMSTRIPIGATELAKIGETAGQLGIRVNDILPFTEVIAKLGSTTNLSTEEAATSLAQFMNVMDISKGNISNLGSTVVALGNNFATNERAIVEMSQRLSGMGQLTKMSGADVMGLAAAMSSVGIEAEAGGSAMTQTMTRIQNAVQNGGSELQKFAKASGVSADQFAQAFKNRPVEALQMFLRNLKDVDKSGGNVNKVLEELGINGIREADAIKRLAGALDGDSGLAKALDIANKGWRENNALTKEAQTKYETTASKVQIAKNEINKMAIEIGSQFLPKIAQALKDGKPFINFLGDMAMGFAKLPLPIQAAVLGAGPLLTTFGGLVSGSGAVASGVGGLVRMFGRFSTAKTVGELGKAASATASTGKAIADVGTKAAAAGSMAPALFNPYVLGATALIGTLGGLGYYIYREMTKDSRNHEAAVEKTNGAYKEWFESVKSGAGSSGSSIDQMSGKVKKAGQEVKDFVADIQKTNTKISESLKKEIEGWGHFGEGSLKGKLKDKYMLSDAEISEITTGMEKVGLTLGNSISSITTHYAKGKVVTAEFASAQISAVKTMGAEIAAAYQQRQEAELKSIENMKNNGTIEQEEYSKRVATVKQKYNEIGKEIESSQKNISDILNNASKERRELTSQEMDQIQKEYAKMAEMSTKTVTDNVQAQKDIYDSLSSAINDGQLKALESAGLLSNAQRNHIQNLSTAKEKQEALNQALAQFALKETTKTVSIKFDGEDILLTFANDFERMQALPDIIKTLKIAEAEGRTVKMTLADLEFLDRMGIKPKNVQIIGEGEAKLKSITANVEKYNATPVKSKTIMLQDQFINPIEKARQSLFNFNATPTPPKIVKANDGVSSIMFKAKHGLDTFNATPTKPKTVMATDNASPNLNKAKQSVDNYNATNPNHKTTSATDGSSPPVNQAKFNLEAYNLTNPNHKSLNASGNATPFTQEATNNLNTFAGTNPATKNLSAAGNATPFTQEATNTLNTFAGTNPATKSIMAAGNATPFTSEATGALNVFNGTNPGTKQINASGNATSFANQATAAINAIPAFKESVINIVTNKITNIISKFIGEHATGGHIDVYANGGGIDMFARGGNIGETSWLDRGYQGIVGEAGPELFTVGRNGVNITPLSTREKIRGITGALADSAKGGGSGVQVIFNMNGLTVREEADIDKLAANIERRFVRAMKENRGGKSNVYTL